MQFRQYLLILPVLVLALTACGGSDDDTSGTAEAAGGEKSALASVKARGFEMAGTFEAPGKLKGYTGRLNGEPVTVYATQDGDLALIGELFNAGGENVGRQALLQQVIKPHADRMWAKLGDSAWVAQGSEDAPQTVYAFSDPNCPYCHVFWKRVQPWIESGQVQVRYVMVGVIGRSSPNKAAAILTAASPVDALSKNHHNFRSGGITPVTAIPANVRTTLIANARLMRTLGLRGTPGIVYRTDKGRLERWHGVPSRAELANVLGAAAG